MATVKVYVGLVKGGYLQIHAKSDSRVLYRKILKELRRLPVISYDKKNQYHKSTIFYLDDLKERILNKGWHFYYSPKLKKYYKRFKERLARIKAARKDTTFESIFWTKKKKYQVRKHQAQAINVCLTAKKYLIGDDMGVGKTIEAIGITCKAFEMGYERALIVVLNRLKYQRYHKSDSPVGHGAA